MVSPNAQLHNGHVWELGKLTRIATEDVKVFLPALWEVKESEGAEATFVTSFQHSSPV